MFELTPEQRRELGGSEPARAVDPESKQTYVLVRAEIYDRLKSILDDVDPETMYPLLAQIEPDDWENGSVYGIVSP